ncbi:LRR receptor-like serine threonine-protein kinase [Seminavis robusta]|uniref:LRR receptor-like serine threonine-protein kinase n=1 Tax=Seminavis robusta TaxID=568900 RepID=A0A9N8DEI2_9STRA|nr:LRR receptor-like serine threonine-protein kinase [Seminavis robusta]|eukprot:Sro52_g030880.1 LRR receptor-like serine threonine-protein kinase (697) ;mRNA; r:28305-30798
MKHHKIKEANHTKSDTEEQEAKMEVDEELNLLEVVADRIAHRKCAVKHSVSYDDDDDRLEAAIPASHEELVGKGKQENITMQAGASSSITATVSLAPAGIHPTTRSFPTRDKHNSLPQVTDQPSTQQDSAKIPGAYDDSTTRGFDRAVLGLSDPPGAYAEAPGTEPTRRRQSPMALHAPTSEVAASIMEDVSDDETAVSRPRLAVMDESRENHGSAHEGAANQPGRPMPSSDTTLPQASLVGTNGLPSTGNFPRAQRYNESDGDKARDTTRQQQFRIKLLLEFIMALVISISIALVVLAAWDHSTSSDVGALETAVPTSPSQAPLSKNDSLVTILPETTASSIEHDPQSPQSKAFQWLLQDVHKLPSLSLDRIRQRFALATLFYALHGNTWDNNTNWLDHSVHECDWFNQPDFARNTTVSQIYHGYQAGLHGSIPEEIWTLTALDTLMLHRNQQLGGTISTGIGSLSKLRWLVLDECSLTGSLPTELGKAISLKHFIAGGNQLSSTISAELFRLSELEILSLDENSLEGTLPTEIGFLTSTTFVTLSGNELGGPLPSELGLLANKIVSLDMKHNQLLSGTIPTELGLLTNLVELDLLHNQLLGPVPSELANLSSLGLLTMANNSLSGSIPREFIALQDSLYTLKLEGNPLLSGTIPEDLCNITGTWISSRWKRGGGPEGLSFDCTGNLCGCGSCPC